MCSHCRKWNKVLTSLAQHQKEITQKKKLRNVISIDFLFLSFLVSRFIFFFFWQTISLCQRTSNNSRSSFIRIYLTFHFRILPSLSIAIQYKQTVYGVCRKIAKVVNMHMNLLHLLYIFFFFFVSAVFCFHFTQTGRG